MSATASPPVVFLHGIGAGAESFDWLATLVPNSRALNLPGFGDEPAISPMTFPDLARWLHGKLEGMGPVVLFGHSFGGMLALETALTFPDAVAGLAICASTPAFGGKDDSFKDKFLAARLGPLEKGATMLDLGRGSASMAAAGTPEDRLEAFAQSMGRVPEAVFRDILTCLTTFDRRADLARVTQPVLALAGTQDQAAPAKTVRRMAEALPHATYIEYDAGHLLPIEAPEAMAADLAPFLAKLEAGS